MQNTLKESNDANAIKKQERTTPTLLLIDDDESLRKVMRFRLRAAYNIIDSGSPEEALALALQHKPAAILLDLMMPKYSGLEVCQTLSSLSFTSHIPILIVSGESSERYKELCESIGAKGFFQKPVDMDALQKKLASLIVPRQEAVQSKPRVRLRVMLKLRGVDSTDTEFEIITATENVSASGFLCGCSALVGLNSIVEVSMAIDRTPFIGKARVTKVDWPGTVAQRCDFEFLEKPRDWILQ
ncbi:MAG TPA: response regulator [Candidatus Binatus sp.]|jgi:CheY-like chemotaxis protein|nr:response regulator [Candidatus Binatus sp.]